MIVAELAGGLGNQLFQYAAARAIADRLGVDLGLDVRTCRAADSSAYALGPYAIRATVVADRDLRGLYAYRSRRWRYTVGVACKLSLVWPTPFGRFARVIEGNAFDGRVLDGVHDKTWISGYWQSERHFAGAADRIRADLELGGISDPAAAIAARIRAMPYPVAVHVRRGDYARVASTRAYHGLCDLTYYHRAMARLRAERADATFVFFSDEPAWVRAHLGGAADLLVDIHGGARPHEDLHLMRQCRAHVIANSTFSWWGAWLADSARTIAPRRWFEGGPVERDPVPARWERL